MRTGVLFVTPHPEDADRLSQILGPVTLDRVGDLEEARVKLQTEPYPVILTDADLPDGGWPDVLDLAERVWPRPQVIVTYRFADGHLWTEALGRGVYDFLAQPFYAGEVLRILNSVFTRPACGFAG